MNNNPLTKVKKVYLFIKKKKQSSLNKRKKMIIVPKFQVIFWKENKTFSEMITELEL